jgi:hypothetical protein
MTITMTPERQRQIDKANHDERLASERITLAEAHWIGACNLRRGERYEPAQARKALAYLYGFPGAASTRHDYKTTEQAQRQVDALIESDLSRMIAAGVLTEHDDGTIERTPPRGARAEAWDADGNLHIIPQSELAEFNKVQHAQRKVNETNELRRKLGMEPLPA